MACPRAVSRWLDRKSWSAFLSGDLAASAVLHEASIEAHHGAAERDERELIELGLLTDPEAS